MKEALEYLKDQLEKEKKSRDFYEMRAAAFRVAIEAIERAQVGK